MNHGPTDSTGRDVRERHTGAIWRRPLSIEARLALSVALSVALVISLLMWLGLQVAQRRLEDDLHETARVTAVAVADDLELRADDMDGRVIASALHDFMAAAPSLRSITVFRAEGNDTRVVASTSSAPAAPRALVGRALATREPAWQDPIPHVATIAVPLLRDDRVSAVVAVSVSLAAVEQFSRAARLLAAAGVAISVVAITLLIHLLARRLVLTPLQEIRRAMARVGAGDMHARADVPLQNELGELARGLNHMLTEIEDLHRDLNARVDEATEALRQRNEQLVRSYESVLTLRDAVARAQQLAAVGQTLANVAHQIGTPLNLVSGHVQLLRQEISDAPMQRRLRIIEEQVARVTDSVRQLLDRARPRGEPTHVDVGEVVRRLTAAMRSRLATAGVTLDVSIAQGVPPVTAEETQLELALLNVLTNAVDAMPRGGTLTVRVGSHLAGLRLEIADTGEGIPPDVMPRIFEPWLTTKAKGRGAGLGLSITRDVVSSLGGTITARSTPGHGSTFTIDLPAAVAAGVQET